MAAKGPHYKIDISIYARQELFDPDSNRVLTVFKTVF